MWNVLLFWEDRGCENRQLFQSCQLQTQVLHFSQTALTWGLQLFAPVDIISQPACL